MVFLNGFLHEMVINWHGENERRNCKMAIITKRTRPAHPDDRLAAWYSQRSTYLKASDRFSSLNDSGGRFGAPSMHPPESPEISVWQIIAAAFGWVLPAVVGIALLALIHTFI
jgi:hypothetical protein